MPEFKEPTREPKSNSSFKEFFDACFASGADPSEYAKSNNIDINNAEFFNGLRDWSKETSGKRTNEEDMLLYKITKERRGCCHADCGGPTCSRDMFEKMLAKDRILPEQNIEMLSEAIKSKYLFEFSKPGIIEDLLHKILKNELSPENKTRMLKEFDSARKYIKESSNHPNPHVLRDLEKLEKTINEYEEKLK